VKARILLAVGHSAERGILARHLEEVGPAPEVLERAADVLERLRAGAPPDLVLLDKHLPDRPGLDLGRALREDPAFAGLTLVLVTANGQLGDGEAASAAGFDAYLAEPLKPRVLGGALAEALRRRRAGGGELVTQHTVLEAEHLGGPQARLPRPVRVLLAEDNRVNQKIAQRMLDALGAVHTLAEDGFQVLRALESAPFDVILMDCQMPSLDGFQATTRIRRREQERGGHIPIIAMTANALEGDRQLCLDAGMDDYLTKPVKRKALWTALTHWAP
jgi:CheY-like chemotaxis protein